MSTKLILLSLIICLFSITPILPVARQSSGILSLSPFRETIGGSTWNAQRKAPATRVAFPEPLPAIKQVTELLIDEALKRAHGNQSIAAGMLGISHQALSKRLRSRRKPPLISAR